MKYSHLIEAVCGQPWLITPQAHHAIQRLVESKVLGGELLRDGTGICGEAVEVPQMRIENGLAIIPIGGVIGQGFSGFEKGAGAVDVADISQEIDLAVADETVRSILFDIDSPGGMVSGTPELGDKIAAIEKPKYAFTAGTIASAAYWIAASTDLIFATKSASIGSIGVYVPWLDYSEAAKISGVSVDVISSGKYKGMGYPGTVLTREQRQLMQDRVDDIAAMFYGHVVGTRSGVEKDSMQGQTFLAHEAQKRGLIDGIVGSFSEVLETL